MAGTPSSSLKTPKKLVIFRPSELEAAFDLEGLYRVHSCKRKRFYLRLSRCCSSAETAPRFSLQLTKIHPTSGMYPKPSGKLSEGQGPKRERRTGS
jgi:hypothetical protein